MNRLAHLPPVPPADPVAQALHNAVVSSVAEALEGRLPRLTVTRAEAGEMLGLATTTIDSMLQTGRLTKLDTGTSRVAVTVASIFEAAGWPLPPVALLLGAEVA